MNRELKEFRRLERVCRESASVSTWAIEREALLSVADDLRKAIEAREPGPQPWARERRHD
ncbi:hypothetical protein XH89_19495 [Bradyrhizobium sp. CCBAU 53340]|nr:hypothetical protein XH89_19495 [Bradyrhizobium sp. CCBAU 53340]